MELSGTSMSTPFVAGVAALMLDGNYALTPTDIKTMIKSTAEEYGFNGADNDFGSGRIRAYRAVNLSIKGENTAKGDQAVPKHFRYSGSMNQVTLSKQSLLSVTNDNYPIACTLIMYDWSGYMPGIDFDLFITDNWDNPQAGSFTEERQETAVNAPFGPGTYKVYVNNWIGSGRYTLDCTYK
jgi:serine protease AprX